MLPARGLLPLQHSEGEKLCVSPTYSPATRRGGFGEARLAARLFWRTSRKAATRRPFIRVFFQPNACAFRLRASAEQI